jgi:hypothetical protein
VSQQTKSRLWKAGAASADGKALDDFYDRKPAHILSVSVADSALVAPHISSCKPTIIMRKSVSGRDDRMEKKSTHPILGFWRL